MTLNLINAFSYYLVLVFVIGTILRARNIRAMLGMVYRSGDRWPKLRALVSSHWAIFVRWPTILPLVLTLLLTLTNTLAGYFVWPQALVTPSNLWAHPVGLAAVIVVGSLMGFLDFKTVFWFGRFDRTGVEVMLDRAEHWLGSWKAPVVRVMTFGLIHPRRIVSEQVRQALVDASIAANGQLWAISLQIVVRFVFGLTLWITWAMR